MFPLSYLLASQSIIEAFLFKIFMSHMTSRFNIFASDMILILPSLDPVAMTEPRKFLNSFLVTSSDFTTKELFLSCCSFKL